MKIGLALGSGSARGLAHIGVLRALEENNIKIDYISGCSIGALIGAAYASGMQLDEIERIAKQTDWKLMAKVFVPTLSLSSLINDKYLLEFLNTYFRGKTIEGLNIPFSAVATDMETGEMIVMEKGSLVDAIRASISIPMLFSPFVYKGRKLIDGGLVNPTPVDVVKNSGVDKIIAVNLTRFDPIKTAMVKSLDMGDVSEELRELSLDEKLEYFIKNPINYFKGKANRNNEDIPHFGRMLFQMLMITQGQMAKLIMNSVKPDILIQPDTKKYNIFDFDKADELIEIGYKSTRNSLKESSLL